MNSPTAKSTSRSSTMVLRPSHGNSPSASLKNSPVVRSGTVTVKEDGFASWLWRPKWLTLSEQTLTIRKHRSSAQQKIIFLRDITNIERVNLKPHCLLLEAKEKRYLLSLKTDTELYGWQDDIYSRSLSVGVGNPTSFSHHIHIAFDPDSRGFVGMPDEWSKLLTKPVISREDYAKTAKTRDIPSSTIPIDTSHASSRLVITSSRARQSVAREGTVQIKADGFASRSWRQKWVVLTDQTLTIHKTEHSSDQTVIFLHDITSVERTDLKPYCLLLETKKKRYYLSLKNDDELYGWHDDVYSRIHASEGVSLPFSFKHNVHVGLDPNSGAFTGLPGEWEKPHA